MKFIDNSKQVIDEKDKQVKIALEAVGIHLEGEAKEELENSPRRIDTGLLRNSITHAVSGEKPAITAYSADNASRYGGRNKKAEGAKMGGRYSGTAPTDKEPAVYIGTNVEYAVYVHEGTSRMNPNRFLKNAIERNASQVERWLKEKLSGY